MGLRYCEDDPKATRLLMEQAAVATTHGGAREKVGQGDNIPLGSARGTSQSHTLARLKRDRPDLAKKRPAHGRPCSDECSGVYIALCSSSRSSFARRAWRLIQ